MCFGGERRVGIRLRRASYFSFVPSHETPRAPQPNSDWVRVCFRPQSSPYFLHKPRTRNSQTNGLEQNKMAVPFCVEHMGWGMGGRGEWVRLRREAKNTSKKYERNWKRRKKTKKKKMTVSQSKSSWKVSTTKSVPALINNKASKVLDAQVEYIP